MLDVVVWPGTVVVVGWGQPAGVVVDVVDVVVGFGAPAAGRDRAWVGARSAATAMAGRASPPAAHTNVPTAKSVAARRALRLRASLDTIPSS